MAEQKVIISDFSGAIATTSLKKDIANSARFVKGLNPFEDPSYITLSRIATKKSSTTVAGKPYWMDDGSPWTTNRFVYDSAGKFYTVSSSDAFSLSRTVSGGAGEGLKVFDDYAYYALGVSLGRYGKLSGTPAFNDDFLTDGTTNLDQSGGGTGQTYATTTGINEGATHRQTFTPTRDPLKSITIDINDTGDDPDWTVTVHDANNTVIGSATKAFATVATGDNVFTFATPLRLIIGNAYHFHVTTTTTTGAPKVTSNVASDLEGAEFSTIFGILIDTDWHPMGIILNKLVTGNEGYLAVWDQATYNPNQIVLEKGFQVRAIAKVNEFIVAEAYKGPSLQEAEAAKRFYWDGISPTFNYSTDITVGACNALGTTRNQLIGVYGHRGAVYKGGGSGGEDDLLDVIGKIPKLARGKYVEVYPGAISESDGRTIIGYAGATDDNSSFEQGIYEIGRQDSKLPTVLNMSYLISTLSTQGSNVHVTMVKCFGQDIYVGWQDGASTYGVDKITLGDSALAAGSWESLIFDGGDPESEMQALYVKVEFDALTTNQSITPKYQLDRSGSFTNGTTINTVGATEAIVYIHTRCKEAEWGFNVASSSNTFPTIKSVKFVYDDLSEEGES